MPRGIQPVRVNHFNAVVRDFDASTAHFAQIYGGEFVLDLPQKEFHACLVETGQVIFELFVPYDYLIASRYGPHFLGLEYQADMDAVRGAVADHGVGIVRDIGVALHTDPADCFGVAFEFYDGEFHSKDWPLLGGPMKPAAYWRDEHPLGLTGRIGHTHAVWDIAAAGSFLQSFLGAEPLYVTKRPAIAGHAIGFKAADATIELVTPDGEGELLQYMRQHGQGIRSAVFGVRDSAQATQHLADHGLPVVPGTADDSFAVAAKANLGLIFEFQES